MKQNVDRVVYKRAVAKPVYGDQQVGNNSPVELYLSMRYQQCAVVAKHGGVEYIEIS
jgi:hypothetical protein